MTEPTRRQFLSGLANAMIGACAGLATGHLITKHRYENLLEERVVHVDKTQAPWNIDWNNPGWGLHIPSSDYPQFLPGAYAVRNNAFKGCNDCISLGPNHMHQVHTSEAKPGEFPIRAADYFVLFGADDKSRIVQYSGQQSDGMLVFNGTWGGKQFKPIGDTAQLDFSDNMLMGKAFSKPFAAKVNPQGRLAIDLDGDGNIYSGKDFIEYNMGPAGHVGVRKK